MGQDTRKERLMPNGIPRYVRCYDNGDTPDATIDRYTVVYTGRYRCCDDPHCRHRGQYVAMSAAPFHPQGFCQHGESTGPIDAPNGKWPPAIGRNCHLGRRIEFSAMPADCQRVAVEDYRELWGLS